LAAPPVLSSPALNDDLGKGKVEIQMPDKGKGGAIEFVCTIMACLSVIGGVAGALAFSEVSELRRSGLYAYTDTKTSSALVAYWLIGGIGAAVFWYALSGIGTALRWLESGSMPNHDKSCQSDRMVSDPGENQGVALSADPDVVTELPSAREPEEPTIEKTPEQIEVEQQARRNAQLFSAVILIALGVLVYLALSSK